MIEGSVVMVTGAQGFVGRYLVARIFQRWPGVRVVGLGRSDLLCSFSHHVGPEGLAVPAPLPNELAHINADCRYKYVSLDLNDSENLIELIRSEQPAVIFHLATMLRDSDPESLESSNVAATETLANAVINCPDLRPRIILGSTGGVYGKPRSLPVAESEPYSPQGAYADSKARAEKIACRAAKEHDLDLTIGRIFNPIGPGLDERHLPAFLASQLAQIIRGCLPPIVRFSPLTTTRDFVDVHDVVEALCILAATGQTRQAYNIGSGRETKTKEIWDQLLAIATDNGLPDIEVRVGSPRAVDVPRHFAAIDKIRSLGFTPTRALRSSLDSLLLWYLGAVQPAPTIG